VIARESKIYEPLIIVERRAEGTGTYTSYTLVSLRSSAVKIAKLADIFYDRAKVIAIKHNLYVGVKPPWICIALFYYEFRHVRTIFLWSTGNNVSLTKTLRTKPAYRVRLIVVIGIRAFANEPIKRGGKMKLRITSSRF